MAESNPYLKEAEALLRQEPTGDVEVQAQATLALGYEIRTLALVNYFAAHLPTEKHAEHSHAAALDSLLRKRLGLEAD